MKVFIRMCILMCALVMGGTVFAATDSELAIITTKAGVTVTVVVAGKGALKKGTFVGMDHDPGAPRRFTRFEGKQDTFPFRFRFHPEDSREDVNGLFFQTVILK